MAKPNWRKPLFILSIAFYLYCSIWSANATFRYEPFCKKLGAGVGGSMSRLEKDSFTYSVHKPPFLSFTGNLGISEHITISSDLPNVTSVDLLIWPRGINDYEVGVGIIETTINTDNQSSHSICTQMMLDENMNLLDDTPENRELYEQNLDKIENLYHLAYEMWGILGAE